MNPVSYPESNELEEIKKLVDNINRAFFSIDEQIKKKSPLISISSPTIWR